MMSVLSTFRKMYKIFDYDGPEWCGWALYFPKTNVGAADQDGKACREAVERGVFFFEPSSGTRRFARTAARVLCARAKANQRCWRYKCTTTQWMPVGQARGTRRGPSAVRGHRTRDGEREYSMHAALQALHVGTERSSCPPVLTFPFHFSW